MNEVHLHLLVNHLPVIGVFMGLIVFILAFLFRSYQTRVAAYTIFIISSIGALIAYITGEGAEESIENLQGITKSAIERHEDFSVYPFVAFIVLGIASIAGVILTLKKARLGKRLDVLIFVVSIVSLGLVAWTGYLGGLIRHTEITTGTTAALSHHHHEQANQAVTVIQLNDGERWQADEAARNAIRDLSELTATLSNDPILLKQSLQQRINRLFQECTMKGEADKQLHNFLIPLMDKIKQLDENSGDQDIEYIRNYLETFPRYFK